MSLIPKFNKVKHYLILTMAGTNGILSAARNIMKFVTEGKGFDRVMKSVSIHNFIFLLLIKHN